MTAVARGPRRHRFAVNNPHKLIVLGVFMLFILGLFLWMISETGVFVPAISTSYPYRFAVSIPNAENLSGVAQVQIAGAQVGTVKSASLEDQATRIDAAITSTAAPLHQGVHVQVDQRTLVGEPVLTIIDGTGPALKNGSTLPASAVLPAVTIGDVLRALPPRTLDNLGSVVRTLGGGTNGTQADTAQLVDALGALGAQGSTVLDAIADQSSSIRALGGNLTTTLDALDASQGEIETLVKNVNVITSATAGQRQDLSATIEDLPGVLGSAQSATQSLTTASGYLAPVASGLNEAAPDLSQALLQLPGTAPQLRRLVPILNTTLTEAPATLDLTPATATDADALIPQLQDALQNINPVANFLKPYGRDFISGASNIGATLNHPAPDGQTYIPILPVASAGSLVKPDPLITEPATAMDPYPLPGSLYDPQPFGDRTYQRVQKESK